MAFRKRHQSLFLLPHIDTDIETQGASTAKNCSKIIISEPKSFAGGEWEVISTTNAFEYYAYPGHSKPVSKHKSSDRNGHCFCKTRNTRSLLWTRVIVFVMVGCFLVLFEIFQLISLSSYHPVIKKEILPFTICKKESLKRKKNKFPTLVRLPELWSNDNNYQQHQQKIKLIRSQDLRRSKWRIHAEKGMSFPYLPLHRNIGDIPDLGDLVISSIQMLPYDMFHRKVRSDDDFWFAIYRNQTLTAWDENDGHSHEKYYAWEDTDFEHVQCQRPKWSYDLHPNCNTMHELTTYDRTIGNEMASQNDMTDYDCSYLAHGHYRDSFLFTYLQNNDEVVVKSLRFERHSDRNNFILIYGEAVVMDVLSSSPRIADMYSYCGDSQIIEKGYDIENQVLGQFHGQKQIGFMPQSELDKLEVNDVHPMNNLTIEEKLDMAIQMAEGIAEQHGYFKGVMMNDDIEVRQWLRRDDGSIFLNDLANTIFRSWDDKNKCYCREWSKYGGDYKAPEEFKGTYVDESSDVWPMGNLIFSLLTGLHPYHGIVPYNQPQIWNATQTYLPYIDGRYKTNRSFIEKRMVAIMDRCYKHNTSDRASIFEIVEYLHETKTLYMNSWKNKSESNIERRNKLTEYFRAAQKRNQNYIARKHNV